MFFQNLQLLQGQERAVEPGLGDDLDLSSMQTLS